MHRGGRHQRNAKSAAAARYRAAEDAARRVRGGNGDAGDDADAVEDEARERRDRYIERKLGRRTRGGADGAGSSHCAVAADGSADRRDVGRSRSRPSDKSSRGRDAGARQRFADPARPFDANGFCLLHKDVHMARRIRRAEDGRGVGWSLLLDACPKCTQQQQQQQQQQQHHGHSSPTLARDNTAAASRAHGGDTESMTTEESVGRKDRRSRRSSSRHDRMPSSRTRDDRHAARRGSYQSSCASERSRRSDDDRHRRSLRSHSDHYNEDVYESRSSRRPNPVRDGRRSRGRDRSRDSSRSRSPDQRSLSRSSRQGSVSLSVSRGNDKDRDPMTRPRRMICDKNGRPFDKRGRCFAHPSVKLASKKLLGGWKIHVQYCPMCLQDDGDGDGRGSRVGGGSGHGSDASGASSGLTDDSRHQSRGRRARSRSSAASRSSRRSSFRSVDSERSCTSWSTGRSSGARVRGADDSFLPLDDEGYCRYHVDVQLAKMDKRGGGFRMLMDFCPECASDSLLLGGNKRKSKRESSRRKRRTSLTSANSSCKSGRSGRSGDSHSTYIESMPYVDGDGKPGHYTGHVDCEGQPNGRGKMKYLSGIKFDGVWHQGTKLTGRTSASKKKKGFLKAKKQSGEKSSAQQRGRASRRDDGSEEEENARDGANRSKRSLSRLRRKCDEIESLLKGPSAARKEVSEDNF